MERLLLQIIPVHQKVDQSVLVKTKSLVVVDFYSSKKINMVFRMKVHFYYFIVTSKIMDETWETLDGPGSIRKENNCIG